MKLINVALLVLLFPSLCFGGMVDVGKMELWETNWFGSGFDSNYISLNAENEEIGYVFQVPKNGNIHKIHVHMSGVAQGGTLKGSLQDVDLATGFPDGVVDQSGTVVVANDDDNTNIIFTLGADRTVSMGDYLSVVIEYDSWVAGNDINFSAKENAETNSTYTALYSASAWSIYSRMAFVTLEYDDGTVGDILGFDGAGSITNVDFNNTDTPDERGNIFQVAAPVRVVGFKLRARVGADYDVVLYDSDGSTVLATADMDGTIRRTTSSSMSAGIFDTAVVLDADTNYYISMKPTSATDVRIYGLDNIVRMDDMPYGINSSAVTRTDAGSWTAFTETIYHINLIVDQIGDGTGSSCGAILSDIYFGN